jgi:hypothetical protein
MRRGYMYRFCGMIARETINCNKILFGKIKGSKQFGDLGLDKKIIGPIEFIIYK